MLIKTTTATPAARGKKKHSMSLRLLLGLPILPKLGLRQDVHLRSALLRECGLWTSKTWWGETFVADVLVMSFLFL